jgi:hypothetical protein
MFKYNPENLGEFCEVEYSKNFTYRASTNPWAISKGLKHEIDVGFDSVRFCTIKRTVAYVCVDEDSNGDAVLEKWKINKHIVYLNQY